MADIPMHRICLQVCLCAWAFVSVGVLMHLRVCILCPWGNCLPHTLAVVALAL